MSTSQSQQFISLDRETRFSVDTATAAFHCNRRPQTLRSWACLENGPLRPIRINGRLAWSVSELRRLLGCHPFSKTAQPQDDAHDITITTGQGERV